MICTYAIFQVEDVYKKFNALKEAESRGWVEEHKPPPPPRQRKGVKVKTCVCVYCILYTVYMLCLGAKGVMMWR